MTSHAAFHLLAKPTGAACNLDCSYCFYLDKEALYPHGTFRMSDEVLERYVRELIAAQPGSEVHLAWQGGEPTLMGLEFFRRSVELVERELEPDRTVAYSLQTNGVLLDDEWGAFLAEHGFLVGISIDGPEPLHDRYRRTRGGAGTHRQVVDGYRVLQEHGVATNVLCTVHAGNQEHPLEVYRYLRDDLEACFLQFIPIVEQIDDGLVGARSVGSRAYGEFLVAIFEEWVRRDVGAVFVQLFDATLGARLGTHPLCVHAPTCGDALAMEHTGDVYSCDHFVTPEHLLGNIAETPLATLVDSPARRAFGQHKRDALPQQCLDCEVRSSCHGGCPKDRLLRTPDGETGLNSLCDGYRRFFGHVQEPMAWMASALRARRPPAGIMEAYRRIDAARAQRGPSTTWSPARGGSPRAPTAGSDAPDPSPTV